MTMWTLTLHGVTDPSPQTVTEQSLELAQEEGWLTVEGFTVIAFAAKEDTVTVRCNTLRRLGRLCEHYSREVTFERLEIAQTPPTAQDEAAAVALLASASPREG